MIILYFRRTPDGKVQLKTSPNHDEVMRIPDTVLGIKGAKREGEWLTFNADFSHTTQGDFERFVIQILNWLNYTRVIYLLDDQHVTFVEFVASLRR